MANQASSSQVENYGKDLVSSVKKAPKKGFGKGIDKIKKAANILDKDKNIDFLSQLPDLKSSVEPEKQLDGIRYMQGQVMSLLAKLKRENKEINLASAHPDSVARAVAIYQPALTKSERISLIHLQRLMREEGPTKNYLLNSWGEVLMGAESASKSWSEKIVEAYQTDPVGATALTIFGMMGVWLGAEAVKALWKAGGGRDSYKGGSGGNKKMSKKTKLLTGMALMVFGWFFGKRQLSKMLKGMGLDKLKEMHDRVAGLKVPAKRKKEIAKVKKKIKQEMDKRKKQLAEAKKKAASTLAQSKDKWLSKAKKIDKKQLQRGYEMMSLRGTTHLLISFFCSNPDVFNDHMRREIDTAIQLIYEKPLQSILSLYESHKNAKSIPISRLNLKGVDPKILFYACEVIAKSKVQYQKFKKTVSLNQTVEQYLMRLSNDPSMEITGSVQGSLTRAFSRLGIATLAGGGFTKGLSDLLKQKPIDKAVGGKNFNKYIDKFLTKFGLDNKLSPAEKKELAPILLDQYATAPLNESPDKIRQKIARYSKYPKVIDVAVQFISKVQEESKEIIKLAVKRYDTKRPSKPDYDRPLAKYLKYDAISLRDGFQLVLLGEGLGLEKSVNQTMGQAKDMAMIYLILKILNRNDKSAHAIYLSNVGEMMTETSADINVNPYFKAISPYVSVLFKFTKRKLKTEAKKAAIFFGGLGGRKYTPEQISKMGMIEFAGKAVKQGGVGSWQVPKELVLTLSENFKGALSSETTAENIMNMVIASAGSIFYSRHNGKNLGIIYLAGKYFFFKPAEIITDTAHGALKGATLQTYMMGTAPFVAIGAGLAGVGSFHRGAKVMAMAMMRGAARGLAAPVTLPMFGFRAARGIYRGAMIKWVNTSRYNATKIGNLASLRHTTDVFLYNDRMTSTKIDKGYLRQKAGAWKRAPREQLMKKLYSDIYHSSRKGWSAHFQREYNAFFDFNPDIGEDTGKAINVRDDALSDIIAKARRLNKFLDNIAAEMPRISQLTDAEFIDEIKKISELSKMEDYEIDALVKRLGDQKALKQFKELIVKVTQPTLLKRMMSGLSSKLEARRLNKLRSTSADEVANKILQNADEALKVAKDNVTDLSKRLSTAEKAVADAKLTGKAKKIEQAEELFSKITKAHEAAKSYLSNLERVNSLKKTIVNAPAGSSIRVATHQQLTKAEEALSDSMKLAVTTADEIGEVSRLSRWLKGVGVGLRWGLAGFGVLGGAYSVGSGVYNAYADRHIESRSALELGHAGVWGLTTAVDVVAMHAMWKGTATAVGTWGRAATVASLPAAIVSISATEAYTAIKNRHTKTFEWARSNSYAGLLHHLFGFGVVRQAGSGTYGEALINAWSSAESIVGHRKKIMNRVFKALIAVQADQELFNHLCTKSKAKDMASFDKKVEQIINKKYTKYHQLYFNSMAGKGETANLSNFAEAKKMVVQAGVFNDLMQRRESMKKHGVKNYKIGGTNLMDDRYEVSGTASSPTTKKFFSPRILVEYYKDSFLKQLDTISIPSFRENLDKMDTNYLVNLYFQVTHLGQSGQLAKADQSVKSAVDNFLKIVPDYLAVNRNVNAKVAMREPGFYQPGGLMSVNQLKNHLMYFGYSKNPLYEGFEKSHTEPKPAVYALYKLGQYFGYTGYAREKDLKQFFNVGKAAYQGIYWHKGQWYVQEAGMEWDDKMGAELNQKTISDMVNRLYTNCDDVLENKADSITGAAFDYSEQVKEMARILQGGFNEGVDKYKGSSKKINQDLAG